MKDIADIKNFNLHQSEEICIIDDSPIPMAITKRICQKMLPKVTVRTFITADLAIVYLNKARAKKRIIFLDLYMPKNNGWYFLEQYNPTRNEKIYILSSSKCNKDIYRAKKLPEVTDYIVKPLTFEVVMQLSV